MYPEKARDMLLWLIGEAGEVADVIKQNGDMKIMTDENVRKHFVEEMCDVMMYFNDVLLCYDISAEEFEQEYFDKHEGNMGRWWRLAIDFRGVNMGLNTVYILDINKVSKETIRIVENEIICY